MCWIFYETLPIWRGTWSSAISVFLFLSKVSVLVHFQESIRWLFSIQTFISLFIHFPFKWPRQEAKTKQQQNKTTFTATRSQDCSPTNRRQPMKFFWCVVTGTLRWLAIVCIAYCIFWHLIGSDQLSYFSSIGQFAHLYRKALSEASHINP